MQRILLRISTIYSSTSQFLPFRIITRVIATTLYLLLFFILQCDVFLINHLFILLILIGFSRLISPFIIYYAL